LRQVMIASIRRLLLAAHDIRFYRDQCGKEFAAGRVQREIEFVCAEIPAELRARLVEARSKASKESSGKAATA